MSKYVINGGKPLQGEIRIPGSKNAVLPLMAAALLTEEECRIENLPQIADVGVMGELILGLGAEVVFDWPRRAVTIKARNVSSYEPDPNLTAKLRASILLVGPLLARLKSAWLPTSGGDRIGVRPIDAHILGFEQLGASVSTGEIYKFSTSGLTGAKIILEESSVTATENLMMAAALADGHTTIKLAAMEPHVQQVGEFLNSMGAKIAGLGTTTIEIEGVKRLHGASVSVIPDSNQAATFITLAAATGSDLGISGVNNDYLDDLLLKMRRFGVVFETASDSIRVLPPTKPYSGIKKLQVGLYPKLASDDTPPLAVLATQAEGETIIYEWMYENRLGYAPELNKMGANTEILDPHRVRIIGKTPLLAADLTCSDIRMGMALVIAALTASGKSTVSQVHHIDRGYENLHGQLLALGADIVRIDEDSKEAELINQPGRLTV